MTSDFENPRSELHRVVDQLPAQQVAEAEAQLARGEGIPHEEILGEFGL